jgi:hypothetical protein
MNVEFGVISVGWIDKVDSYVVGILKLRFPYLILHCEVNMNN